MDIYFGGIQGGGTCSDAVILNRSGEVVGKCTGLATNPWYLVEVLPLHDCRMPTSFSTSDPIFAVKHNILNLVFGMMCLTAKIGSEGVKKQMGFDKCVAVLGEMIERAKKDAGLDTSVPLEALGMSLSGGEMVEAQERIVAGLKKYFPNTSKDYHVCTDTFGSIATAFPNGH